MLAVLKGGEGSLERVTRGIAASGILIPVLRKADSEKATTSALCAVKQTTQNVTKVME